MEMWGRKREEKRARESERFKEGHRGSENERERGHELGRKKLERTKEREIHIFSLANKGHIIIPS